MASRPPKRRAIAATRLPMIRFPANAATAASPVMFARLPSTAVVLETLLSSGRAAAQTAIGVSSRTPTAIQARAVRMPVAGPSIGRP